MHTLVNVLIVATGFASTLIAFGGKTWLESDKPLPERITGRGWLALIALLVATSLGVSEKLMTRSEEAKKSADADSDKQKGESTQENLRQQMEFQQKSIEFLTQQLTTASGSLADAKQALADNKQIVDGIAVVDREMSQQVAVSTKITEGSGEIIKSIEGTQHELRNLELISALSRSQSSLEVVVEIPATPRGFTGEPDPENPTDLFFPEWRKLAKQAQNAQIAEIRLSSDEANLGSGMLAVLWSTRDSPTDFQGPASADQFTDPLKAGTQKGLDQITARLSAGDSADHVLFRFSLTFEKTATVSQWLSSFKKGTQAFSVSYLLRPELQNSDREKLTSIWANMFAEKGKLRLPVLDLRNFALVYPLRRIGPPKIEGDQTMSMTYEIDASPTLEMDDIVGSGSARKF